MKSGAHVDIVRCGEDEVEGCIAQKHKSVHHKTNAVSLNFMIVHQPVELDDKGEAAQPIVGSRALSSSYHTRRAMLMRLLTSWREVSRCGGRRGAGTIGAGGGIGKVGLHGGAVDEDALAALEEEALRVFGGGGDGVRRGANAVRKRLPMRWVALETGCLGTEGDGGGVRVRYRTWVGEGRGVVVVDRHGGGFDRGGDCWLAGGNCTWRMCGGGGCCGLRGRSVAFGAARGGA